MRKYRPQRDSISWPSSPAESLYRLSYSDLLFGLTYEIEIISAVDIISLNVLMFYWGSLIPRTYFYKCERNMGHASVLFLPGATRNEKAVN